ncbi:MAG: tRNA (adenosine(37)-N6)-dimethylallyltransferase MiaA [Lentisphaerae bacterium]|mgnify:CR=1 FL=1|jgi:tRNA dimethylallyltransferase|nr:tRNA (adenosine(37)-N6)-dimethylallyltransferase MiaA [Lentisphaerota bacterium]MBT4822382.1 tRNA (adenosine(37)-N6)-dimethylallyltransferase MiaA [Lentisphaerota bacterium]MBT5609220.1 tRNA (adenosine(37)-N6)-dimethylallyltransferase MiaA [Lentisphaerota bacterium]MBT7059901.1 tRNA (adenosine(37)-N6)-dimethylallyltransferase MiaA [Lentisphaerota bacterium]MBT7847134.1 tRNA (adenosine(37)-N6)-dimethylallyltransferase MiaA [Lentisphaerota bacterium]
MPTPEPSRSIRCVFVVGPTASGKTRLGVSLARHVKGEIVSADSRQVYRRLDIGTGKDLAEYGLGNNRVPYHLIDVASPTDEFHLFRYLSMARTAITQIAAAGHVPIVVGGTPLYVSALMDDYELEGGEPDSALRAELEKLSDEQLLAHLADEAPDIHQRTDKTQRRRIIRALEIARTRGDRGDASLPASLTPLLLAPYYPRERIHARIAERLDARLAEGLVAEVTALHAQGVSWERMEWLGLEYRYVSRHLTGALSHDDMRNTLLAKIRRFCKSQDVWYRKMERNGKEIHWIPEGNEDDARVLVEAFLSGEPLPSPKIRLKDILYGPRSNG